MHEMKQSGEYVKCLHVAAALHFYNDVEAKDFFAALVNEDFEGLSRRENIVQNTPDFIC